MKTLKKTYQSPCLHVISVAGRATLLDGSKECIHYDKPNGSFGSDESIAAPEYWDDDEEW